MISIVFCSKEPIPQYVEHLKNSCGVKDVEVIPIKNNGDLSLAQAYDYGLKTAKHNTVVFTHDDVAFNTQPWGYKLLKHFDKNPEYGIIGLAGTDNLVNGKWWHKKDNMLGRVYHQKDGKRWLSEYSSSFGNQLVEVVSVDGVFMAIRKDRIKRTFNTSFRGFHFYDIPICLDNHLSGVKIGICTNIELTHFSVGVTNQEWDINKSIFEDTYSEVLPLKIKRDIILPKEVNIKWKKTPKVSVIIPTKDKLDLLLPCIDSITKFTKYPNYEVLIADTGSTDENKETIQSHIKDNPIFKFIEFDYYHFAKINNEVVKMVEDPELLLFCNNDVEFLNDTISRMVNTHQRTKNVGTVGARLHYEDTSIQHNGIGLVMVNRNRTLFTIHKDGGKTIDYNTRNVEVIGNTAACLMIGYELFNDVGMFNEDYRHCFEDVELNIMTLSNGHKNIVCSEAVALHKESQSRDVNDTMNEFQEDFKTILLPKIVGNFDKVSKHLIVV
jgi:GT2 family glycosyltransferase